MILNKNLTLPESLDAERHGLQTDAGHMAFYADTSAQGRPLVLLHSINASPTAMEVKPLFDHYRGSRPVYAPELPGFGFSDRSPRDYTPTLFARAVNDFLSQVPDGAADVLALSTTAEFIARAALDNPEHFRSLTLVSPTGMGRRDPPSAKTQARLKKLFNTPVLSPALYRLLTSRPSIRYFLGLSFQGDVPVELIDQACATVRMPGASHAPFDFLSMGMFTPEASDRLYRPLQRPTLVLYDQDPNVSFDLLETLQRENPNIQSRRIAPTQGLPHFDEPEKTFRALDEFWRDLPATDAEK
ncbi:MAG: alpha/beta hydrolase [Halieaceae bacterium]|jgi:pimeloyl-ACP methyl ester carboxylesterase|nr:alpha/beta hydrolase [Halieaceae bacterium]